MSDPSSEIGPEPPSLQSRLLFWADTSASSEAEVDDGEDEDDQLPPPPKTPLHMSSSLVSSPLPSPQDTRLHKSDIFTTALETSFSDLANKIWDFSTNDVVFQQAKIYKKWLYSHVVLPILLAIGRPLLQAIINGNVHQGFVDGTIKKQLDKIQNHCVQGRPCIYMQEFADRKGLAPTPAELDALVELMRWYCKPHNTLSTHEKDMVTQVERAMGPDPSDSFEKGGRKYLATPATSNSDVCRGKVRYFCDQLCERVAPYKGTSHWSKSMNSTIVEVGYTMNASHRLNQHRSHTQSNYIMNLMEAAAEVKWPGGYKMRQHVVFAAFRPEQGSIGEKIVTTLAQGYTKRGTGFSHALAGISCDSIRNVPVDQWWAYDDEIWSDPLFKGNLKEQREFGAKLKRKEALKAEIAKKTETLRELREEEAQLQH